MNYNDTGTERKLNIGDREMTHTEKILKIGEFVEYLRERIDELYPSSVTQNQDVVASHTEGVCDAYSVVVRRIDKILRS